MSFLKKVGQVLATAVGVLTGIGPIFAAAIPGSRDDRVVTKVVDTLAQISGVVVQVEAFSTALTDKSISGADKLRAAAPLVEKVIRSSELIVGREIADEKRFSAAVTALTSAWVDILNSLKDEGVKAQA